MSKLATILMTSPGIFGAKAQRWLLEQYNCSLGNGLITSESDPEIPLEFPDAKHIIPIFGYPESWGRMHTTYEEWMEEITFRQPGTEPGGLYYYNCGDGAWNGLDEPGSRGRPSIRHFNYGRAYQENEMVHALMPGLKTVVTHPFPLPTIDPDFYTRINSDVWAWRFKYLIEAGEDWRETWGIPDGREVWGYLIDEDLHNLTDPTGVGEICRRYGLSACLIYKATHPALYDEGTKQMTAKGKALLEGMQDA